MATNMGNPWRMFGSGYQATTIPNYQDRRDQQAEQQAQRDQQFFAATQEIAEKADPFASQRGQYQQKLSDLINDPQGALANNPFFKASAEQGEDAAMRRLRQMGMGNSGNAALELQKASQANMADQYFPMAQMLSGLSGAQFSPAAGAGAMSDMLRLREGQRQFDLGPSRRTLTYGGVEGPETRQPGNWSLSRFWGG